MEKTSRLLLLVGWIICAGSLQAGDFEAANQLYDDGKFGEAKPLYERAIEQGEWSANLFYNLGNAEYRLGSPGRAMLNYERALALDARHVEARANLHLLRDQVGARVPTRRWWDYAFPAFSGDLYAIVAALSAWVAIFAVAATLFGRRAWGWLTCALLLTGYAVTGVIRADQDRALAVITVREVSARVHPADRAALAEPLPAGSRVRILSERGDWIYCALPGGGRGWIPETQLEQVHLAPS